MLFAEPAKDALERVDTRVASAVLVVRPLVDGLLYIRRCEVCDRLLPCGFDKAEGGVLGVGAGFVSFDEPRGMVGTDDFEDAWPVPCVFGRAFAFCSIS